MQEKEFEKSVQHKMDELRLHPSAAVWPKVEAKIKKEKRRRWIIILFPVILAGFLYGGYLVVNKTNAVKDRQQPIKPSTAKNKINHTNENPSPSSDSILNDELLLENTTSYTRPNLSHKPPAVETATKTKFSGDHKIAGTPSKETAKILKSEIDSTTTNFQNKNASLETQPPKLQPVIRPESAVAIPDQDNRSNEIITDPNNKKNETRSDTTPTEKKITRSNKRHWNFGFSFSGGRSGPAFNFGANQNSSQNYLSSPPAGSISPSSVFGASPILPSVAFITGLSAEKSISPKLIFSTGLNYKLFITTNLVGPDSANTFRSFPLSGKHRNFFHYIDLPVGMKVQLGNAIKTPGYWNIGLSLSKLISSNALQFNSATGLYFHDNSQFNKMQLAVYSGIDIPVISKQKISLLAGPYLNYNISKVAAQGYYKSHFDFIGLHTQVIFRKK